MYCGVCKGIAQSCGQGARMGLTYDVTFLSVILHNIAGIDVKIEKQHCLTHCIRSKMMANVDDMTKKLGALNTALVYYKYTDDILDGDKGRGKRLWFVSGHKKTVRNYPEIERIVRENLAAQQETEKSKTDSLDRAADASANMMAELSDYLLEDKKTPYTHDLFYAVGKWIYLIDALDDYDKDKKKGAYNPFVLSYSCEDKADLMKRRQKDVEFVFHSLFFDIRENLSKIKFHFNRDLSDNILLRGLPSETKRVMCSAACKRCKDAPPKETKGAD
ncbi:MAG: hypothetical protein KH054_08610 [Firmicutes bacterium]|nr:hypothetical protein [Bacillota bacterium]